MGTGTGKIGRRAARAHARASMRVSEARESFADAVNRVAYSGERIVLDRRGKRLAAIVPVEDLDLIEAVEDRIDLARVKARLLDKSLPLDKVLRNLGL